MAISVSTRKKKAPVARKQGSKMSGPSFAGWENWSGEEYCKKQSAARTFFYENYQPNDLMADVWLWMKENNYTSSEIAAAKVKGISVSAAITCRLLRIGMPEYNPKHNEYWQTLAGTEGEVQPASAYLKKMITYAVDSGKIQLAHEKAETKKKANLYIPSIQERVRDAAYEMTDLIEEAIDRFITSPTLFDPAEYKIAAMLRGKGAKAAHARLIKHLYGKELEEYTELMKPNCPDDLMEGYRSYGKKNIKKMFDFFTQVSNACDQITGEAKITRAPRKIKVKSPEDQVKSIKFKASDDRYGIASVPPSHLVGATAVIVFNTKTRKIGMYVADQGAQVLAVKGTTLIGFDEKKSLQKTLRKPEQQIKEFKTISTQKRMQVWIDGIKTTSTVMNGRINADVMILKAWK